MGKPRLRIHTSREKNQQEKRNSRRYKRRVWKKSFSWHLVRFLRPQVNHNLTTVNIRDSRMGGKLQPEGTSSRLRAALLPAAGGTRGFHGFRRFQAATPRRECVLDDLRALLSELCDFWLPDVSMINSRIGSLCSKAVWRREHSHSRANDAISRQTAATVSSRGKC